jgi:hypothetical protein
LDFYDNGVRIAPTGATKISNTVLEVGFGAPLTGPVRVRVASEINNRSPTGFRGDNPIQDNAGSFGGDPYPVNMPVELSILDTVQGSLVVGTAWATNDGGEWELNGGGEWELNA